MWLQHYLRCLRIFDNVTERVIQLLYYFLPLPPGYPQAYTYKACPSESGTDKFMQRII